MVDAATLVKMQVVEACWAVRCVFDVNISQSGSFSSNFASLSGMYWSRDVTSNARLGHR